MINWIKGLPGFERSQTGVWERGKNNLFITKLILTENTICCPGLPGYSSPFFGFESFLLSSKDKVIVLDDFKLSLITYKKSSIDLVVKVKIYFLELLFKELNSVQMKLKFLSLRVAQTKKILLPKSLTEAYS